MSEYQNGQTVHDPREAVGKTRKALDALPDGGVYVAFCGAHVPYCRDVLRRSGRHPEAVAIVPLERVTQTLEGRSRLTPIALDHLVLERPLAARDREAVTWLRARFDRAEGPAAQALGVPPRDPRWLQDVFDATEMAAQEDGIGGMAWLAVLIAVAVLIGAIVAGVGQ